MAIDLDPSLEKVCQIEKGSGAVQKAIDQGLPKTKVLDVPFRMEMSGFARIPGSIPIVGDIGMLWPILAHDLAQQLDLDLKFMSYPQQSAAGQSMREWIVGHIQPACRKPLFRHELLRLLRLTCVRRFTPTQFSDMPFLW